MELKNIKILGGLGGLFFILSFFVNYIIFLPSIADSSILLFLPYVSILIAISGIIFSFIAMYKISQYTQDKSIFKNFLIAFMISFFGGTIALFAGIMLVAFLINGETVFLVGMVIGFVLLYIITVISGYFYNKAFSSTAELLKYNLFKIGGKFIFWGCVATIVFIGIIGIWVGWILIAIAFFTLPNTNSKTKLHLY